MKSNPLNVIGFEDEDGAGAGGSSGRPLSTKVSGSDLAVVVVSSSIDVSGRLGFVGSLGGPPSTRLSRSGLAVVVMSCSIDVSGRLGFAGTRVSGSGLSVAIMVVSSSIGISGRLALVSTLNVNGFGTFGNHEFGNALNR